MKLFNKVKLIRSSIIAIIFALYINIIFQISIKKSIVNSPFFLLLMVLIVIAYIYLLLSTNEIYSKLAYQYFNQILVNIAGVCLIVASFVNVVMVINYKPFHLEKYIVSVLTLANISLIIGVNTAILNIVFWNKTHLLKDNLIISIDTQKIKFSNGEQLTSSKKFNIVIANHSKNDKIIKFYGLASPKYYYEIISQDGHWNSNILRISKIQPSCHLKAHGVSNFLKVDFYELEKMCAQKRLALDYLYKNQEILFVFLDEQNNVYILKYAYCNNKLKL